MKRLFFLTLISIISSISFAQQGSRLPDNKELVQRHAAYYVESDSFYMEREALESSLLGQKEFKAWDLQVTERKDLADMIVRVKRVPFSNHFSYTVTDRETDTIVMAGKVDSLAGTVYGRVAKEIVEKMVALRGQSNSGAKIGTGGDTNKVKGRRLPLLANRLLEVTQG